MGATDTAFAGFREPPAQNFAFFHEVAHNTGDVLYRNLRIEAMLVQQIGAVGTQAL